jgi:DNA-binding CsgD family transcriptional regulator
MHAVEHESKGPGYVAEEGLILMDLPLKLIAFDRGAAAMLNYPNQPGAKAEPASCIPKEILDIIRSHPHTDLASEKARFRIGKSDYVSRFYLVESQNGSPLVAVHLEKDSSSSDAIEEAASKYHLTEREQEALKGILMGLASKELAERMNISPNTVKAFLRLIMIKMGVTTRAGVVAKILQNRTPFSERAEMANDDPRIKKPAV